ncbi:trypco2 family protein [Streptomyces violens]|uniref:trypco2 family protein n=1 Tax=Streptomyces violens TaxID=66377 RepID=UPI00068EADB5|nr:trypco2 family protein [Streptomyces violens]
MERSGAATGLDLSDAIVLLRGQLSEAQHNLHRDGDRGIVLTVDDITLELGMELTHARTTDASLRFSVVGVGGKRDRGDKTLHKVTVHLKATAQNNNPLKVADKEKE